MSGYINTTDIHSSQKHTRRDNQKAAQCNLGSVNGPVHCMAGMSCVCILFCMSNLHCTCPSPHK